MTARLTNEQVLNRLNACQQAHLYDYSLVEYVKYKIPVKIICKDHGAFLQRVDHHISGAGCPKCKKVYKPTTKEVINRFEKIHGKKYNYSLVEYINMKEEVKIICPIHGVFEQTPNNHLAGYNCEKCGKKIASESTKLGKNEFVKRSKLIHGDKYDYSKVIYQKNDQKVIIICPKHGEFKQTPQSHMFGNGCWKCGINNTSIEKFVESFLKKNDIKHRRRDRTIIKPNEVDFFCIDHNIAIECDGLYYHCQENKPDRNYHLNKTEKCKKAGVRLIHIFENEIKLKSKIVISRLSHIFSINKKKSIFARKCDIRTVDKKTKTKFLEKYHIQGRCSSNYDIGLFFKNRLVAIMCLGKLRKALGQAHKDGEYELLRYCSIFHFNIVGGPSKLLKYFERTIKPKRIITYADIRWNTGKMYDKIGFKFLRKTKPNYWYIEPHYLRLHHRFNFRKNVLHKRLKKFDESLSEYENMRMNNWHRIWDCGNLVFEKKYA